MAIEQDQKRGRGRPKKESQSAELKVSNKESMIDSSANVLSELLNEIRSLKGEIEKIKEKTVDLENADLNVSNPVFDSDFEEVEEIEIPLNASIKVMSLIPYELNITTEGYGKGRPYTFRKYGEVKRIIYSDLNQIIETNRHHLEAGRFIILSKKVVQKHGLEDIYSGILSKEKIDVILIGLIEGKVKENDVLSLLKSSNAQQQENIINMIIDKQIAGESVDLNLLDKMARMTGIDISLRYENNVEFLKTLKSLQK